MKEIETERLFLRFFTEEDAFAMYRNWASDEKVTRFLSWSAHQDVMETQQIVNHWVERYNTPNFYHWAIVEKESEELIGSLSVVDEKEDGKVKTIGYALGYPWWNQGYMTEAVQAVLKYLLEETETVEINAYHEVHNHASGRVMRKAGMEYVGLQQRINKGKFVDVAFYEIKR